MTNTNTSILAYKAFNKDWTCRDFQYEVGKTYKHDGDVEACQSGFHACEYPLDIFNYYSPCTSKFALVEASGAISKENFDSKIASEILELKIELSVTDLVKAAIDYTVSRTIKSGLDHTTGYQAASSATGNQAASSATGNRAASSATGNQAASSATGCRAASSATGNRAASSATGDRAASSATGYQAASSATGNQAASSATGNQAASSATGCRAASSATGNRAASSATGNRAASSATGDRAASLTTGDYSTSEVLGNESTKGNASAIATGYAGRVKAPLGCALFLVERDDVMNIINVWSGIVGKKNIKPNTWYTLKDGKPTIVGEDE